MNYGIIRKCALIKEWRSVPPISQTHFSKVSLCVSDQGRRMRETLEVQREVENEHDLRAVCLLISRLFSVPVSDVNRTLLLCMRLFARDKARKETYTYEICRLVAKVRLYN